MHDPQAASKLLVDHALSRFSTDNLSCMIVRFDSSALRNKVERRSEPIGVEGDPGTKPGALSEADALVLEAKQKVQSLASTDGVGDGDGEDDDDDDDDDQGNTKGTGNGGNGDENRGSKNGKGYTTTMMTAAAVPSLRSVTEDQASESGGEPRTGHGQSQT